MGLLKSQLFSMPVEDSKLEACLVSDAAHITHGANGMHVKKIQMALNALSKGAGRENFNLGVDGKYGPATATAVKKYKNAPSRRILQPWQTTADDIVGKRTIKSLDDEMQILEEESLDDDPFVSITIRGAKHDHSKCPKGYGDGPDKKVQHKGTPVNPQGFGRMLNIYGEGETDYVGFKDVATDREHANGRPLTQTLPDSCASDICIRSSPIDKNGRKEISRIAMVGCRITVANPGFHDDFAQYVRTLGPVIRHMVIWEPGESAEQGLHVLVVQVLFRPL